MAVCGSLIVLCGSMVPVFAWAQAQSGMPAATDLLSAYRAALANDPQFASARAQSLAQRTVGGDQRCAHGARQTGGSRQTSNCDATCRRHASPGFRAATGAG